MTKNRTLLVTGASGQLGRRVVELLADDGVERLVATTRHPARLAKRLRRGGHQESFPLSAELGFTLTCSLLGDCPLSVTLTP